MNNRTHTTDVHKHPLAAARLLRPQLLLKLSIRVPIFTQVSLWGAAAHRPRPCPLGCRGPQLLAPATGLSSALLRPSYRAITLGTLVGLYCPGWLSQLLAATRGSSSAPPTEAQPPGHNPNHHRGVRLPRLAVVEEVDSQEAWITGAHSDTVSFRARALGAASRFHWAITPQVKKHS